MIPREDYISVVLESRPDLYGPFWTLTTVIFSLFVFSSLSSSIASYLSSEVRHSLSSKPSTITISTSDPPRAQQPWDYDFKLLSVAVGIIYGYGLAFPIALWAALRYIGVQDWGLLDAVAVWGYGMTVWMYVLHLPLYPYVTTLTS